MGSMTQVEQEQEPLGLARTDQVGPGTLAMALMSDDEFETRLAALQRGQARIARAKLELMQDQVHYGTIPGTKKPTLLKPGAEVLCSIYGLRPDFAPEVRYGDGETAPSISVRVRCELHHEDLLGPVVAVGYGVANSWEPRYRYRQAERTCPECGAVGAVIKGKEDYGGGWLCWRKAKAAAGCGAKFAADDPRIAQQTGKVNNPDPYELENTLVKMGEKRAHIDATLRGTASSDLFTQDMEDQGAGDAPSAPAKSSPEREPGSDDNDAPAPPPAKASSGPRPPASRTPQRPAPDAASVPVVEGKPSCGACGHGRAVICKPDGTWACSPAKGGCGAVLGRVK